jgi:hypothetical protein
VSTFPFELPTTRIRKAPLTPGGAPRCTEAEMRTFGLSAAAVLALAAPARGYQPLTGLGEPAAIGYSTIGDPLPAYPPPVYGDLMPAGGFAPAARGWYGSQECPPGCAPAPAADPCGYAFDPRFPKDRRTRPRCHHESWVRGDWLYWHFRDTPLPPLVVTGNPALANPGIPGLGNVTPLVGGARDQGPFHGVRVTIGQWFDPDGELGAEASWFIFGREGSADFFTSSAALPILSVPVIGTDGTPAVYDFAFPGRFAGALGVRTAANLMGAEGNLLHRVRGDGRLSVDGLFGYRFLQLIDRIDLLGRSTPLATGVATFAGVPLPAGVTVVTADTFRARTEFHGVQLGSRVEARRDMFTLTAFAKGGAGINVQTLRVDGNTTATGFGVTRTAFGGVRALPSNFGRDTNTDFSLVGETGIEVGVQVTKNLSLLVGYNLLYWSDVLRPGSVIDPVVTFSQVPIDPTFGAALTAPARPVTVFRSSDFLAHGLVVGMKFDW